MPKEYLKVSGVWFFDSEAGSHSSCRYCKYISSQMIPRMEAIDGLAKTITEHEPDKKVVGKKIAETHQQVNWFFHCDTESNPKHCSLLAKPGTGGECSISFDRVMEPGPIIQNKFRCHLYDFGDNQEYARQWFMDGVQQLKDLDIIRALLYREKFVAGSRVRIRQGFPPRKRWDVFEPDKPRGKVLSIKRVTNIEDNRGFQVLRFYNGMVAFSQHVYMIAKRKRKEATVENCETNPSSRYANIETPTIGWAVFNSSDITGGGTTNG